MTARRSAGTRLALISTQTRASGTRTRALAASVLVVAVLGFIGWVQVDAANEAMRLDFWARIYRTVTLFTVDAGDVAGASPLFNAARFLAPITVAATTLNVVLGAAHVTLHRWASRRAKSHRIVLGPLDRSGPYVGDHTASTIVHADDQGVDTPPPGVLHTRIAWTVLDATTRLGLRDATEVVIATEDDQLSLELLATVLQAESSVASVRIEIDDITTSLWLSIAHILHGRTGPSVDVISREQARAELIGDAFVAALDEAAAGDKTDLRLALVGDGNRLRTTAQLVLNDVLRWQVRHARFVPTVLLLDASGRTNGLVEALDTQPHRVAVRTVQSAAEIIGDGSTLVVAVVTERNNDGHAIAFELLSRDAQIRVLVPAVGPVPVGLVALRFDVDPEKLRGPIVRVAEKLDATAIEAVAAELRRALALLSDAGCVIEPAVPAFVPAPLPKAFAVAVDGEVDLPLSVAYLPYYFSEVGVAVALHSCSGEHAFDVELPSTVVIDDLAMAAHAKYLERATARGLDPNKPTHRPWKNLESEDKAQNIDQIRWGLVQLGRRGYRVEPVCASETVAHFGKDELEELARAEHDRWALHRWMTNYRVGSKHVAEKDGKREHPDLIAYDDLKDDVKQYDRDAYLAMPELLADIGLQLSRSNDRLVETDA